MNSTLGYQLSRNSYGRLVFTNQSGLVQEGVVPVRSFPITEPDQGIALIDLPEDYRVLIESELANREFMPEIKRILKISSFITPNTWRVETDRGNATFIFKGEENIRRLTLSALMITDSHGIHFLIRDRLSLDRHSRKLLDHFL